MDIRRQTPTDGLEQFDLTLTDAVKIAWQWRKVVFIATAVTGVLALGAALIMQPVYRAEAVVVPVSASDTKGLLSGLAGQLGSLALEGLALPKSEGSTEALGTINSWNLVSQYIERNDLLPVLYPKQWDANRKMWIPSAFGKNPTVWRGTKYFIKSVRTVIDDKKTGLITVSIDWRDPALAAKWANGLVAMANDELRDRSIADSERNIEFLNEQLAKTNAIELRTSIYQLMEEEIKKAMAARGSNEFAFRIVDPAVVPQDKVSPRRTLMTAVGAFVGFLLGTFFVIRREYVRRLATLP